MSRGGQRPAHGGLINQSTSSAIQQAPAAIKTEAKPATGQAVTNFTTCPCRPASLIIRNLRLLQLRKLWPPSSAVAAGQLLDREVQPCRWPGAGCWPTCAAPPWFSPGPDRPRSRALTASSNPSDASRQLRPNAPLNSSSCDSNLVMSRFCAFTSASSGLVLHRLNRRVAQQDDGDEELRLHHVHLGQR